MLSRPEPPPTAGAGDPLWPQVIERYGDAYPEVAEAARERHAFGVAKYGVALRAHNGRDWLVDALQEALDLIVYLEQGIEESDGEDASDAAMMQRAAVNTAALLLLLLRRRGHVG